MNLEAFDFLETHGNFLNLTLLICHLFAGGRFRTLNILYHPGAFEDGLSVSIDSVCPFRIPKTTQDISTDNILQFHQNQRTDKILQLIFLPLDKFDEHFNKTEKLLTYYRIFVFTTSTQLEQIHFHSIANLSSSTLFVFYDTLSDTLSEYILSSNSMKPVQLNNGRMNSKEIFNSAFSEKASGRFVGAAMLNDLECGTLKSHPHYVNLKKNMLLASFFYTQLKLSYIEGGAYNCFTKAVQHQTVRPVSRSFYSDYYFKYETIPDAEK